MIILLYTLKILSRVIKRFALLLNRQTLCEYELEMIIIAVKSRVQRLIDTCFDV